jgi:hypothetical protein
MSANTIEYRGYTLTPVERAPGWLVYICPGPHLLHPEPDQVSGVTEEEAFTKARSVVDRRLRADCEIQEGNVSAVSRKMLELVGILQGPFWVKLRTTRLEQM